MRHILFIVVTIMLVVPLNATSKEEEGKSYISYQQPFMLIENVNRQAEAWATCSSVWNIMAELSSDSKAQAEEYHNLGNGAKMAIVMTFVTSVISEDTFDQKRFNATWRYAKTLMYSMPEVKSTSILADLESKGMDAWFVDFGATMKHCTDNLESQQYYVDMWRSLATSGLLESKK
ncbi:MAG: hypothetical protein ACR2PE_05075 [Porticoccus sp.]